MKHSSTHRGVSDVSESSLGAGWGCGVVLGQGHVLACCPGASAPRLAPLLLVTRDSWAPAETRQCSALAKTAIWEQLVVLTLLSWPSVCLNSVRVAHPLPEVGEKLLNELLLPSLVPLNEIQYPV